ncbi:TonB-dependent receptor [Cyclobacterium marinum]|uniref:TonB-dependent receptor n=1 Tax=Cyclobacterium marinum (strain ATCC 25205 / DSM 745 / LMG 13164 / NCIMB 1802) TaxID=880070 RepID=G0J1M9_CYCMS|nr:TonB-dependent receptor [Cyclobacterium marinum]AEL28238.1 TonB-dependent receptor [Cyclobacterium marinum DSM 745]
MKSLIMILLTIFTGLQVYAQNNLSGKITDKETNGPLVGVHIYIADLQKGTTTNTEGLFEIKNLPQGLFLIEIGYLGYANQAVKTAIQGETTLNIELAPSITEISEIVITGTSASTERKLNPIPTIVIDKLSSQQSTSTNIIDAISTQPGISQITTGGAISKPVIRGLGYNRVVVLNNNIRQEGQQWGDEHGIEIDEYSVDRVEIIKGPGSLMYGSDAMAGVIHFLAPKPVEEGKIIGNLMTNYQTNNNLIGYSAMNAGNINGINWLARLSSKTAGNYENAYDGKVYNSGFKELNFNGIVGINKKWGYSQLHFSNFNQALGLIEGERDSLGNFIKLSVVNGTTVEEKSVTKNDLRGYGIDIPRQGINHFKVASTSKVFFKNTSLSLNFAFQQNSRKEFADPLDEQATDLFFLLNTFNYDIKYLLPEFKEWQTSLGINGMQQSSYNKGEEFLIPEYNLFDVGVFALTQKSFNKFHLSGGFRYDFRNISSLALYLDANDEPTNASDAISSVKFGDFKTTYSNVSGSVGGSYRLTEKFLVKLNGSRGFRSPNIAELGSNGLHEGTFRYELGNTQLKPETSLQIDAGLQYSSKHVSLELAVFNNAIQNYIFLQKLNSVGGGDSIINVSDPAPTFQFVQGNANLYGGEFEIDIHPHPLDWLHFKNSFSFVRGEQLNQSDSSKYLPFMPAPKIQSELRANFKKLGSRFRNLYMRFDAEHTFKQAEVLFAFNTETPTQGYTLLGAGIGANILSKNENKLFSISLTVNNILDVAYQSHLSRLKYAPQNEATGRTGVFNMGRNFSIKMLIPLTFRKKSQVKISF